MRSAFGWDLWFASIAFQWILRWWESITKWCTFLRLFLWNFIIRGTTLSVLERVIAADKPRLIKSSLALICFQVSSIFLSSVLFSITLYLFTSVCILLFAVTHHVTNTWKSSHSLAVGLLLYSKSSSGKTDLVKVNLEISQIKLLPEKKSIHVLNCLNTQWVKFKQNTDRLTEYLKKTMSEKCF